MRAFVTGATGFIGGHVARRLVESGWQVSALARSPERTVGLKELGVTLVPGDITEPTSLEGPMAKADAVFHLAAWYQLGVMDRMKMFQINVKGTENVMAAAAEAGVPKIVHCSSVAVLGVHEPGEIPDETHRHSGRYTSVYEETKWQAHELVNEFAAEGLPVVNVMPAAVYGPGDTSVLGVLMRYYAKGWLIACPFMDAGVSWVRVEDVADGFLAPLTGTKVPRFSLGPKLMRLSLPLSPLVGKIMRQPPGIVRDGIESLTGSIEYSSEKARRELGYAFRSVEEGIPETVEWYRENT
jgi:nucleoside-diphosphate-sugar epimerase